MYRQNIRALFYVYRMEFTSHYVGKIALAMKRLKGYKVGHEKSKVFPDL